MKKKLVTILCVTTITASMLAGCGSKTAETTAPTETTAVTETAAATEAASTEAASETAAATEAEDDQAAADKVADRKSTRLNSSHVRTSRMPSSA